MVLTAMGRYSPLVSKVWEESMNWKEEAAQRLGDYRYMRNAQGSIHREIKRLEKEAAALKSLNLDVVCTPNAPGRKEDRLSRAF